MSRLLTRSEFRDAVFARDHGACVRCGDPAIDAHHLLERRLFPDGGYYLGNGAAVCARCHLDAEYTRVSPDDLRRCAGIATVVLPPGFVSGRTYDKWGNEVTADGHRVPGPLFDEPSVQTALRRGGALASFW